MPLSHQVLNAFFIFLCFWSLALPIYAFFLGGGINIYTAVYVAVGLAELSLIFYLLRALRGDSHISAFLIVPFFTALNLWVVSIIHFIWPAPDSYAVMYFFIFAFLTSFPALLGLVRAIQTKRVFYILMGLVAVSPLFFRYLPLGSG